MRTEEKQLLLKDICARLPYRVICHTNEINIDGELIFVNKLYNIAALYYDNAIGKFESCPINDIKPYLRPMSSMTEEEVKEFAALESIDILGGYTKITYVELSIDAIDWLNSHHFDYRGLIPMGLGIDCTGLNIY